MLALAGVFFAACRKDDVPDVPAGPKERTLLIYMAAQNSLGNSNGRHYDYENIESLLAGLEKHHLLANNIVIYHDPMVIADGRADTRPRLLQVVSTPNGESTTREIEIFAEQNSASEEVMSTVIDKVLKNEIFAADRYSFLMWSHGTGWLPSQQQARSRAIGQDYGPDGDFWMEVDDFAAAIPDGVFDYIAVDACYMSTVEVAYALRNDAETLIAAPTEIMGTGMPYRLMPDYLLGSTPDYDGFCDAFYEEYVHQYGSTISLIDLSRMDALAAAVKDVLADVPMENIHSLPTSSIQVFDRISPRTTGYPVHIFFDLGSFIKQIASESQWAAFEQAIAAAVPYERHSDSFLPLNGGFEIEEYSGLSVYIPRDIPELTNLNAVYQTLEWYRAVYE